MHPSHVPGDLRGIEAFLRRAQRQGDHETVIRAAREGAKAARAQDNAALRWHFERAHAEALHALDSYRDMLAVARRMGSSPAAAADAALRAQSLVLESIALRCQGRLSAASNCAGEALGLLGPAPRTTEIRAQAFQALIAALVEAGRSQEAWARQADLALLLESAADAQTAGKGFWTLGNLAFLVGETDCGLDYHARASSLLSSANDIQLWARFNRASADLQLQAGLAIEQTRDCIERAMLAHEVMAATEMDRVGLAVARARWDLATNAPEAADEVLATELSRVSDRAAAYLVPAYRVWGTALEALKRPEAAQKFAEAARLEALAGGDAAG
ncbi:hypothetical protein NCCP1664_02390 [Zafaria cholistanensis]|uniref:Uncharacterized protein n=1 Tax=Zafaria cholistanensis TaxID=1682741 RepID=A0A5A7NNJ0_9MICC|nr:hypothetical protein [Zafaria cholistanensis]GER21742.1 hypothetical protein NCCP1664_02390 [Zafaria cholistanensis]